MLFSTSLSVRLKRCWLDMMQRRTNLSLAQSCSCSRIPAAELRWRRKRAAGSAIPVSLPHAAARAMGPSPSLQRPLLRGNRARAIRAAPVRTSRARAPGHRPRGRGCPAIHLSGVTIQNICWPNFLCRWRRTTHRRSSQRGRIRLPDAVPQSWSTRTACPGSHRSRGIATLSQCGHCRSPTVCEAYRVAPRDREWRADDPS